VVYEEIFFKIIFIKSEIIMLTGSYWISGQKKQEHFFQELSKDYSFKVIFQMTQWDDDEVRFVLDQHPELDIYSASSLKNIPRVDM
jgi:hypothetical protein